LERLPLNGIEADNPDLDLARQLASYFGVTAKAAGEMVESFRLAG